MSEMGQKYPFLGTLLGRLKGDPERKFWPRTSSDGGKAAVYCGWPERQLSAKLGPSPHFESPNEKQRIFRRNLRLCLRYNKFRVQSQLASRRSNQCARHPTYLAQQERRCWSADLIRELVIRVVELNGGTAVGRQKFELTCVANDRD